MRNLKTRKCDRVDRDIRQWLTEQAVCVLHVMNRSFKLPIEKRWNIVHAKYIKCTAQ